MRIKSSRSNGFTLLELIVFIIILGIATTGLFKALNDNNLASVNPLYQVRALELAQAQLDEIFGKRYDENSPNGGIPACDSLGAPACSAVLGPDGESRAFYDDVDDYNGLSETLVAPNAGYQRDVSVVAVRLQGQDAKLIRVTVTPPVGNPVDLSAYRANY